MLSTLYNVRIRIVLFGIYFAVGAVPQQDEDNDLVEADKCIWLTDEQMSASVVIGQESSDDAMRQLLQRSKHLCAVACKSPS